MTLFFGGIMLFLYFIIGFLLAEPSETITVEAHKGLEVYVVPTKIVNYTDDIEAIIGEHVVFGYTSTQNRQATYKNITGDKQFKVYNEDTIKYAWDNCDYKRNPKKCSYQNNHYLLETYITVDTHELVVAMYLFDPNMQVISMGIITDSKTIRWIRQQEVTVAQSQGMMGSQTTVHKPKEELPLKWEIPHYLLNKHINQASKLLWWSALIKE